MSCSDGYSGHLGSVIHNSYARIYKSLSILNSFPVRSTAGSRGLSLARDAFTAVGILSSSRLVLTLFLGIVYSLLYPPGVAVKVRKANSISLYLEMPFSFVDFKIDLKINIRDESYL